MGSAVLAAVCLSVFAYSAPALPSAGRDQPGWIGLYTASLLEWLENENRLNELCGRERAGTPERRACHEEKLKPKQLVIHLHSAPDTRGTPEGAIVVEASPGRGLRAYYRPSAGEPVTEFATDLYDADWGYGPYFHQTFLERRGTWFLLPAGPLPKPAWMNLGAYGDDSLVRLLGAGDIVKSPSGDLVVLGVERGVLRARPEQKADMWCGEGKAPALRPWKEIAIPVEKLYSTTGHLLVGIKYTRGC